MGVKVTVDLPEDLAERAKAMAAQHGRPLEAALVDMIDHVITEPPVDYLPDDQILALCDAEMGAALQTELSELLQRNREDRLSESDHARLDELMRQYRKGLVRKAQAWKTAVTRGLRTPLH
jgi:hypothetical protein